MSLLEYLKKCSPSSVPLLACLQFFLQWPRRSGALQSKYARFWHSYYLRPKPSIAFFVLISTLVIFLELCNWFYFHCSRFDYNMNYWQRYYWDWKCVKNFLVSKLCAEICVAKRFYAEKFNWHNYCTSCKCWGITKWYCSYICIIITKFQRTGLNNK